MTRTHVRNTSHRDVLRTKTSLWQDKGTRLHRSIINIMALFVPSSMNACGEIISLVKSSSIQWVTGQTASDVIWKLVFAVRPCLRFARLLSVPRCSRRDRCLRAEETFRYATDIDRCVKVIAHPDSIAVSAHSVPVGLLIIAAVRRRFVTPITAGPCLWAIAKCSLARPRVISCNISRIEKISSVRGAAGEGAEGGGGCHPLIVASISFHFWF